MNLSTTAKDKAPTQRGSPRIPHAPACPPLKCGNSFFLGVRPCIAQVVSLQTLTRSNTLSAPTPAVIGFLGHWPSPCAVEHPMGEPCPSCSAWVRQRAFAQTHALGAAVFSNGTAAPCTRFSRQLSMSTTPLERHFLQVRSGSFKK